MLETIFEKENQNHGRNVYLFNLSLHFKCNDKSLPETPSNVCPRGTLSNGGSLSGSYNQPRTLSNERFSSIRVTMWLIPFS